jgi:hypothetical protein
LSAVLHRKALDYVGNRELEKLNQVGKSTLATVIRAIINATFGNARRRFCCVSRIFAFGNLEFHGEQLVLPKAATTDEANHAAPDPAGAVGQAPGREPAADSSAGLPARSATNAATSNDKEVGTNEKIASGRP